ncbi:MAG TPA: Xaa-Pro peptidase family protein [Bryobacteraceae bacterium]|nr:Xaa-Pro peptidase family protein [Bryobacteraceae bacterium]
MSRLSEFFPELKIDAVLVSGLSNIRYLSGFTGDNALLLVTAGGEALFTDPRYEIQAAAECRCAIKISKGPLIAAVAKAVARKKLKRLGFEKARLTYASYQALKEALPLASSLKPVGPLVETLRMKKNDGEIDLIRRSVETNSLAFDSVIKRIRAGVTENDVAAELEYQMRRHGAQKPAFETIVAFGPRTALPHAQPTAQRLEANQLLLIDMGASRAGYASDMTRVLFLGKPETKLRQMYRAVLDAQLAAISAVRAGITADRVDAAARKVLKISGLEKKFVHSTGHGLGLEIHEPPRLGRKDKTLLEAGMAITIEPGAYIENYGGIRIEDTILVTQSGCEVLTPTSKELMLL